MKINFLQCFLLNKSLTPGKKIRKMFSFQNLCGIKKKSDDVFEKFTPLVCKKSASIEEAKDFARQNFNLLDINCTKLSEINSVNRGLCNLYNMNKGKLVFPQIIRIYTNKYSRYSGEYDSLSKTITLNGAYNIFSTLAHEIGHINHEKSSRNYLKMGKKAEISAAGFSDFSLFDKFIHDKQGQRAIRREVCSYACSSPAEFIACTFESLANGRKLSDDIFLLYKEYEGPNAEILKPLFYCK